MFFLKYIQNIKKSYLNISVLKSFLNFSLSNLTKGLVTYIVVQKGLNVIILSSFVF